MQVRMLTTRRLAESDLPEIEALHSAALCDPPIGIENFGNGDDTKLVSLATQILQSDVYEVFGAFYNDELVGLGVARRVEAKQDKPDIIVHIEVLYVRPEFRRRGIGQMLLGEIADWAALLRAPYVVCLPLPAAKRARRYLAKMGFLPGVAHRVIPTSLLRRRLDPTGQRHRRDWLSAFTRSSSTRNPRSTAV